MLQQNMQTPSSDFIPESSKWSEIIVHKRQDGSNASTENWRRTIIYLFIFFFQRILNQINAKISCVLRSGRSQVRLSQLSVKILLTACPEVPASPASDLYIFFRKFIRRS